MTAIRCQGGTSVQCSGVYGVCIGRLKAASQPDRHLGDGQVCLNTIATTDQHQMRHRPHWKRNSSSADPNWRHRFSTALSCVIRLSLFGSGTSRHGGSPGAYPSYCIRNIGSRKGKIRRPSGGRYRSSITPRMTTSTNVNRNHRNSMIFPDVHTESDR